MNRKRETAEMTDGTQRPGTGKLPELLRFENGDRVNTTEDWKRRR